MRDIRSAFNCISKSLSDYPLCEAPEFEARIILCELLECEPSVLPLRYAEPFSDELFSKATAMAERRKGGEPLQYILGKWEFMSLPFYVGSGVFIPGPDTEHLAQAGIDFVKQIKGKAHVLDLCSGSGCIGISVAHYCPNASVDLVEFYPDAFGYLKKNIELSGNCRCRAINSDALTFSSDIKYDALLSNPPYVTIDEYAELTPDVTAQPKTALTDGGDGLSYYRIITKNAENLLREGGMLAFEIGFKQFEPVNQLLSEEGYNHIHCIRDYNNLRRVVIGYR